MKEKKNAKKIIRFNTAAANFHDPGPASNARPTGNLPNALTDLPTY